MTGNFAASWAIILLPLIGFLVLAFGGTAIERAAGKRALALVSVFPLIIAFLIAVIETRNLAAMETASRMVVVSGPPWIDILGLKVPFELLVDPLSMTMALIVTGIGSLIFVYATGYMAEERDYSRFFTYMNLFAASMLLLVLANNLPLLFVGWEGVGLCSYLLIGFWYKDLANAKAANKAFIVNRIGDWGLTLGILLIVAMLAGSHRTVPGDRYLSYDSMLPTLRFVLVAHPAMCTAAALLLFVGACGKSAQFPLYLWLPDAMAGPTPVSALIHAATMVTSGVVLLNRMHVLFEISTVASAIVCAVGAFTALFAALIAFGQTDIKKVLAYSTVSQLGFMFIGAGAGAYWSGMFHVTTHAFFKALLFLGAGAVIHAMGHNQDMRNYGNLRKYMPITTWTMVIGWLAISAVAIPNVFGFAGAYSKEAILGAALANTQASLGDFAVSYYAGWLGLFVAVLTAAYMTRLTWLTFFGGQERWRSADVHQSQPHIQADVADPTFETIRDPNGFYLPGPLPQEATAHEELTPDHAPKEVSPSMWAPLAVLAALSLFGGFLLKQNDMFENWLAPSSAPMLIRTASEPEGMPLGWISLGAALLGILAGIYIYRKGLPQTEGWDERKWSLGRILARDQFGFDRAMTMAAVEGGGDLARGLSDGVEDGVIDNIVNGLAGLCAQVGRSLSVVQHGLVRSYALLMLIGGIAVVAYMSYALGLPPTGGH